MAVCLLYHELKVPFWVEKQQNIIHEEGLVVHYEGLAYMQTTLQAKVRTST